MALSGGFRREEAEYTFAPITSRKEKYEEDAWDAAINYKINNSHIYVSYGESFRFPLLDELFNFYTNSVDDSLEPQKSENWEVGAQLNFGGGFNITANWFWIETEDEIFYNPVSYANENLDGDTIRTGFETGVAFRGQSLSTGIRYTYTQAEIDGGQFDGEAVPNVSEHLVSADIGFTTQQGYYIGLNATYVGERPFIGDYSNVLDDQESYTVVNAKIRLPWRWLTFFMDFNNIFNEEYSSYGSMATFPLMERAYYPSPEFNMIAGISARFGRN